MTDRSVRDSFSDIDRVVASTLQTDEVMQRSLDAGILALHMDAGIIEIRERDGWRIRYQKGFSPDVVGEHVPSGEAFIAEGAARLGHPFTVANLQEHDDLRSGFFAAHPVKSILVVPLAMEGEVSGCVILATTEEVREFSEVDIDFARNLASSASLALANAKLYEGTLQARLQAEIELDMTTRLLEAADALASSMDLDTVLQSLTGVVIDATGRSRVIVSLYDPEHDELIVQSGQESGPFSSGTHTGVALFAPEVRRTLKEKRSFVIDYDSSDIPEVARKRARSIDSRIALSVPLVFRGVTVGHVRIDEPGSRAPFSAREIAVAEAIASQAAVSIENARLYAAEQEHARLAEKLTEIDNRLHSSMERRAMMRSAVADGAVELGADTGAITSRKANGFLVEYSYGFPEEIAGTMIPKDRERHSVLALQSRKTVVVEDTATDSRVDSKHLASYGVGAVIVVPLVIDGEATSALYFNFGKPHRFTEAEIDFARRVGASLSLAMENARLLEIERANSRANEALARIDQSIHSTLDRDEILRRVAEESADAIGADSTVLALIEDNSWVIRYASNLPPELIGQGFTEEQAPFMLIAAKTGKPVAIEDAFADSRAVRETQEHLGVRAVMMVALVVRDEVIGGLFFNYKKTRKFTREDIVYASRLASSVGLAIVNGMLFEAERDISDRLQAALLQMPERLSGVDFTYRYNAAAEATRVGGDFYDIFELSDNRVGITIGDVAGKGLDAAVLTSLAKNSIRAHATEQGKTPAQVLAVTNEVVYRATHPGSFVTIFFGILNCRDGHFVYSNAGHPATGVLRGDWSVDRLGSTGPLLGAFMDSEFTEEEIVLDADELLFLYTDGLTEARSGHGLYGEERLFDLLSSVKTRSTRDVVARVVREVMKFSKNMLSDDLAILAVKRLPHEECPTDR